MLSSPNAELVSAMVYKFRVWLSAKLFYLGKLAHPDLQRLRIEIKEAQSDMASFALEFEGKE